MQPDCTGSRIGGSSNGSPLYCGDGYAAYAYYRHYFSYCPYMNTNFFVASEHTWLGCAKGDVGVNEFHLYPYTHILTRYRFVPNNYTVSYNGNGATTGAMANQNATYDQTFHLTAKCLPARRLPIYRMEYGMGWKRTMVF